MSISTTTQLAFWGLGIGLDIGFDFKYGWENRNAQQFQTLVVNNKAAGFTKTASMMINLEAVDTKYSYWVQPFVVRVSTHRVVVSRFVAHQRVRVSIWCIHLTSRRTTWSITPLNRISNRERSTGGRKFTTR
jgi:hypothetical protein